MRVASVFLTMPVGGAEDLAAQCGRSLAPRGVETYFVCLREAGAVGQELRAAGEKLHVLPVAEGRRFSRRGVRLFSEFLREQKISVVHSHTYHAHTYAIPAARMAGCRAVLHHHKTLEKMKWHRWWTMWLLLRRADRVLALSADTARDLRRAFRLPEGKVRTLPNAVDTSVFHPLPLAEKSALRLRLGLPVPGPLFLTVASLHPVKNHRFGLRVLARLAAEAGFPQEARWVIVGEGRERESLQQECDRLGLRDRVIFAGRQRPVAPWLQAADAFFFPSTWEGQSLALLQARACGLPILASSIEGNTALLGVDHPGLFALDGEDACAALWQRAAGDSVWRENLVACQEALDLPCWDDLVEDLHGLYRELAETAGAP